MSNRMWGGRFSTSPSAIMEEINASIGFDQTLWMLEQDLQARALIRPGAHRRLAGAPWPRS